VRILIMTVLPVAPTSVANEQSSSSGARTAAPRKGRSAAGR